MSIKHYCDFAGCGALIDRDGVHGKFKRGVAKLAGRELDLCDEHAYDVELLIFGPPPDEDQPPARVTKPRSPKPKPGPRSTTAA